MKDYRKAPVRVQKKSGFDKSFQNLFTSKVGTITPILVDELMPNTTVDLSAAMTAALPPLASDTFMRCKLKYASFFVPTRLLVYNYEEWLTQPQSTVANLASTSVELPVLKLSLSNCYPGSLADYLGVKYPASITEDSDIDDNQIVVSALPFLAYHRIYDDWFRNSQVQKPVFADMTNSSVYRVYNASKSRFIAPMTSRGASTFGNDNSLDDTIYADTTSAKSILFGDGSKLTDLRQANFDYDIYTSCTTSPQNGGAAKVSITTSGTDANTFTISGLRAANAMQQFLERNNLAGNRMVDYVKAHFGANLNDAIAQRPILLGSGSFDVYSKGIYQTTTDQGYIATGVNNPFNSVGSKYGSASADGSDHLVSNFTTQEPGYLFVVCWLSPKRTYGTGIDPMLRRYNRPNSQSDLADAILQGTGNEPIYKYQLSGEITDLSTSTAVFGYNERYANWKDKTDEVHGLLRDDSSLQSFALQTSFDSASVPSLTSLFLEIPTDYLDQVSAVEDAVSKYGYWCDTFFKYRVSMPLAQYSIPSLEDVAAEHGETVMIDKNDKQLS